MKRTSEDLSLLLSYLSTLGVWAAIPTFALVVKRDHRADHALKALAVAVAILILAYVNQWKLLFPRSAAEE